MKFTLPLTDKIATHTHTHTHTHTSKHNKLYNRDVQYVCTCMTIAAYYYVNTCLYYTVC